MFPFSSQKRSLTCISALLLSWTATLLPAQELGQVDHRTYFFEEAERDMKYSLFLPKSYDKKKATPLVVLLHGLGSNPRQVMSYQGITSEADKRGYIVVAPDGYNSRGWYGSRGKGKAGFRDRKGDPDNLGELSEQDVMNVLAIVQKEFKVDDSRIYLMGHSMGGSGTIHIGVTHPEIWAGLAPLAPALDRDTSRLRAIKHIPIKIVTGDKDRLVRVETVRLWVKAMKKLGMDHDYVEIEGGDHVRAIARNGKMIASVFDFFDSKQRSAKKTGGKKAKKKKKKKAKKCLQVARQRGSTVKRGSQQELTS